MSYFRRMAMAMPIPSPIDGYVKDGLVLAYDGYQEPSGGVWKDLSGSGNDLILADDVAYDADAHKVTFAANNFSKTTNAVAVDGTTGVTIELVSGSLKTFFESVTDWPYSPRIFHSSPFLYRALNANNYIGASIAVNTSTTILEEQFAVEGANSVDHFFSDLDSGWRHITRTNKLTHTATNFKMRFGYNTIIFAFRVYSRKLSEAELLQNRLLDAQRFNLSTTNIQA